MSRHRPRGSRPMKARGQAPVAPAKMMMAARTGLAHGTYSALG